MACKVSVILPVYNVENYIRECLDSLVNQTLKEIEIICVDDGSTDSTLDILREYEAKDDRIHVLTQKNQFAGVARNNGMKTAAGDYLIFLDSDDFFEPELCEKAYAKGIEHDADIVMFGARRFYDSTKERILAPWYFHSEYLSGKPVFNRFDFPDKLLRITTPAPWTKAYKRTFVEKEALQYQGLQNSNDAYFSLVAVSIAERISWVDDTLVNYRVGMSNNLQATKKKNPTCFMQAYYAVYQELQRRGIYHEVEKSFVPVAVSGYAFNLNTVNSSDAVRQIYQAMSSELFTELHLLDYPKEYYPVNMHLHDVSKAYAIAQEMKRDQERKQGDLGFEILQHSCYEKECPVSVIIPVYNVEAYLRECLDSIVQQTKKDIEIICVNDGSTDGSMDIVWEYAKQDHRFAVIDQKNMGPSLARNHGLEAAKGTYVYFMDSDDILEVDACEILFETAEENQLDLICFNAECFGNEEDVKRTKEYYHRQNSYETGMNGMKMFMEMEKNSEFRVAVWLQFFRRSVVSEHQIWFHPGVIHEDNYFSAMLMIKCERTGFLDRTFFHRRYRDDSIMTSKKSFKNSYGYFAGAMDLLKARSSFENLDSSEKEAIYQFASRLLWNAIDIFMKLDEDSQMAYKGLSEEEAFLFKSMVAQNAEYKMKLMNRPLIKLPSAPKKQEPVSKNTSKKKSKRKRFNFMRLVYRTAEKSPKWLVNFVKKIFDLLHLPY